MRAKAYPKKTRFLVWGYGVTGRALVEVLSSRGYKITVVEESPESKFAPYAEDIARQKKSGVTFHFGKLRNFEELLRKEADVLSPSPGIKLLPQLLKFCEDAKIQVAGEIEIAARMVNGKIIAVTGTDGKTTTSTLIHHILTSAGIDSHLAGNIGTPFISLAGNTRPEHWLVVEVSSYQLETVRLFRPHIAVLLNIAEDHLERHGEMRVYVRVKGNVFDRQRPDDHAIVNFDDPMSLQAYGMAKSKLHGFTLAGPIPDGAFRSNGNLMLNNGEGDKIICGIDELKILGEHNQLNALASAFAAHLAECPVEEIAKALRTFEGLPHRIEKIADINDVAWVNDSKATNIHSTISALKTFERPVILLLGGYEKGLDINDLIPYLYRHTKHVVLLGDTRNRFKKALKDNGFEKITMRKTLQEACATAYSLAEPGDVVLLSPASSSFDQFKNYEERGDTFRRWVIKKSGRKEQ